MTRRLVAGVCLVLLAAACSSDDPVFRAELAGPDAVVGDHELGIECHWPMFGHDLARTFSYPCETAISPSTVADLREIWFFKTSDVVSASPVVVDGRLYVGDWAGAFYALDADTGDELWRVQLATSPFQYGGQISASAAFAEVAGADALIVGSGKTVYALDAADGTELWSHPLDTAQSSTEILSSPLVVGNLVILTYDTHGAPLPSGVKALDLATGEEIWYFDPELGGRNGCGGVWGSPTVDVERGLVFAGSANCPASRDGWTAYTEALFALDATTGEPRWSFQPHGPNDRDIDFAGAPNLFTDTDGRALVGLGNKDAHYYAVDRETGEPVWATEATEEGFIGTDYSSGGFVGPTAVTPTGLVVGGTGVGACPCMHAFDTTTGEIVWQQLAVEPTYAPTTEVGGVVFVASIDTVLRAIDAATGEVLWQDSLGVLGSGGIAVVGDDLWAVAGFREPGSAGPSQRSGVFRYSVDPSVVSSTTTTTTTTTVPPGRAEPIRLVDASGRCIEASCETSFDITDPPPGTDPSIVISIEPEPFEVTVEATGLGDPGGWLREGSAAAEVGAVAYGVMISERDDDPNGGFLCVLDGEGTCSGTTVPRPGASYNRISVLAIADTDSVPDAVDGFSRLVDSIAFTPPLQTEAIEAAGAAAGPRPDGATVVLSGQNNDLVAYTAGGERRLVIENAADDPDGRDINGQICFLHDGRFIAGEDTGQPEQIPGWGIFALEGSTFDELTARQVGKLIPTYQAADSQPEMFGCGVLPDGRVVTTDVGNQAAGPGTGQLMVWFPPIEGVHERVCMVDTSIATAQQIAVDGDDVLVASARPPTVGVRRYTDLPTTIRDCDRVDAAGAFIDDDVAEPTLFIDPADGGLAITNGIVATGRGGWFVSSVLTGRIAEYDADGGYVRAVLAPPEGETLGAEPFSTGTPAGLAVDAGGSLWYADLGLVVNDRGIGPGSRTGTVRVIRFVDGEPLPPETIDDELAFPDALGVLAEGYP